MGKAALICTLGRPYPKLQAKEEALQEKKVKALNAQKTGLIHNLIPLFCQSSCGKEGQLKKSITHIHKHKHSCW